MPAKREPTDDRDRRARRSRKPERRILVVCGAARTERDYFDDLRESYEVDGLRVISMSKDPLKVVRHAIRVGTASPDRYDEVWCVLDLDEYDLAPAVREADGAGIRLAVSVPCFELWLLLHWEDSRAAFSDATVVLRRLRKHVPMFDKSRLRFSDFVDGVPQAIKRAQALDDGGAIGPNPSTGVWRLVETITKEARR